MTSADRSTKMARELEDKQRALAINRKSEVLEAMHGSGQLMMWPEDDRAAPNEFLRSGLFSSRNRNVPRSVYLAQNPLQISVVGGGHISFIGEEVRQDDQTVWLQLVQLSKAARCPSVTFTPHSFLKAIDWPTTGPSYSRLLGTIRRLTACTVEVYSSRHDRGISTRLLAGYEYSHNDQKLWNVKVFDREDRLLFLYEKLYSRIDWETRLALPEGVATWLHAFFCTHQEPYALKVETLLRGAGIEVDVDAPEDVELSVKEQASRKRARLRDAKKILKRALDALVAVGFLQSYEISKAGLVSVVRTDPAPRNRSELN